MKRFLYCKLLYFRW